MQRIYFAIPCFILLTTSVWAGADDVNRRPARDPNSSRGKATSVESADAKAADAKAASAEAVVRRRIDALQTQLDREEKKLRARLAEFSRSREAALRKQDAKQMERIERLERETIKAYEQRIQQLVGAATSSNQNPAANAPKSPAAKRTAPPTKQTAVKRKADKSEADSAPRRAPNRLFRFFRFGR